MWIVVALVAVAVAIAAGLWLRGGGEGEQAPEQAEPAFDEGRAMADLERLQQLLARAAEEKRDVAPLVAEAGRLADRYPQWTPARVAHAKFLLYVKRYPESYEAFARALELNPADADTHRLAGSVAMKLDRPIDGQRHFAQAVGLEPRNASGRVLLATALARQDRVEDARKLLLEALKLDSSLHQAHFALAELYIQQNKINLALDQVSRALELLGDDPATRSAYLRKKAGYLRRANRAEEALAVLRELKPKELVEPDTSEELAQTFMLMGRPEAAARHYEQVLFLNPLAEWAAVAAAEYSLKADQPDKAREHVDALRRINPRSPRLAELERAARGE